MPFKEQHDRQQSEHERLRWTSHMLQVHLDLLAFCHFIFFYQYFSTLVKQKRNVQLKNAQQNRWLETHIDLGLVEGGTEENILPWARRERPVVKIGWSVSSLMKCTLCVFIFVFPCVSAASHSAVVPPSPWSATCSSSRSGTGLWWLHIKTALGWLRESYSIANKDSMWLEASLGWPHVTVARIQVTLYSPAVSVEVSPWSSSSVVCMFMYAWLCVCV